MSTSERGKKMGTHRVQIRKVKESVLVRGLSERDHDVFKSGEGERNILGQLLGGVDTGQGPVLENESGISI
jgi:hypothetical protein